MRRIKHSAHLSKHLLIVRDSLLGLQFLDDRGLSVALPCELGVERLALLKCFRQKIVLSLAVFCLSKHPVHCFLTLCELLRKLVQLLSAFRLNLAQTDHQQLVFTEGGC